MLLLNAKNAIAGTTKEHLGFSMALEMRVFIVINKIDCCTTEALEQTVDKIEFLLKSPGENFFLLKQSRILYFC